MCLTCTNIGSQGKEAIKKAFQYSRHKSYIHSHNNRLIRLNDNQIDEIIDNALCIICTGVDLSCDIWAIQWDNDYIPKHL